MSHRAFVLPVLFLVSTMACTSSTDGRATSTLRPNGSSPTEQGVVTAPATTNLVAGDPSESVTPPPTIFVDPSTTVKIQLEPVTPQDHATGRDENGIASAKVFNACLASGNCREIAAPLVAYPGAQLPGFDLGHSIMTGADFRGANLAGADLQGAQLSGADFSGADLSGASLAGADLKGATLRGAMLVVTDMRGVDLFEAIVDGSDFSTVTFCRTTWVDGRNLDTGC